MGETNISQIAAREYRKVRNEKKSENDRDVEDGFLEREIATEGSGNNLIVPERVRQFLGLRI